MDAINFLIAIIDIIQRFFEFGEFEFECFEIDDRPGFYLGVFTLRPKEDG